MVILMQAEILLDSCLYRIYKNMENKNGKNQMIDFIIKSFFHFVFILLLTFSCTQTNKNAIPDSSHQMVLVLTDSTEAITGSLNYFERGSKDSAWILTSQKIPVVLGRNGLGWGRGLHSTQDIFDFPIKKEGDGRSPAGVFRLSSVFGYKPATEMSYLTMPYVHITEMVECIDDADSKYYNRIVAGDKVSEKDSVDWRSSEKMRFADLYYELGVVVDHNSDPIKSGLGSCIFLHNWIDANETMAGCTAMDPSNMQILAEWLDENKDPVLVQLTRPLYYKLQHQWKLPKLNFEIN
jgi:D-alanyl-D-alanine dipeptidase